MPFICCRCVTVISRLVSRICYELCEDELVIFYCWKIILVQFLYSCQFQLQFKFIVNFSFVLSLLLITLVFYLLTHQVFSAHRGFSPYFMVKICSLHFKMLSTSGEGLCPWTSLGALPPDPRYRLALPCSARTPVIQFFFRQDEIPVEPAS